MALLMHFDMNYLAQWGFALFIAWLVQNLINKSSKPTIIQGTRTLLNKIQKKCPILTRGPKPPLFLTNCHLQFLPWVIQNELHRTLFAIKYQRMTFTVTDCLVKTQTIREKGQGDSLPEDITVDIFPSIDDPRLPREAPVILFLPGLRCHSQDLPGTTIVRRAFAYGMRSITINRRGHTPDTPLKSPRWSLFGDIDDLEQVYWKLKDMFPDSHFFICGISSGCALVITGLGEWDGRLKKGLKAPSFTAALSISPGYDITNCLLRFDWPYEPLLLHNCKAHFIGVNEKVLREYNSTAVDEALEATTLHGFLEASAPFTGYQVAENFYRHANPVTNIHQITTPCGVFNAKDDPCCKYTNAFDISTHLPHKGRNYSELVNDSPLGLLVLTNSGSHCPFLDGTFVPFAIDPLKFSEGGTGLLISSWCDEAAMEWFSSWIGQDINSDE